MNTLYLYKGNATVTAIDSNFFTFYAQDEQGAAEIRSASGCGYEEVDLTKVTASSPEVGAEIVMSPVKFFAFTFTVWV